MAKIEIKDDQGNRVVVDTKTGESEKVPTGKDFGESLFDTFMGITTGGIWWIDPKNRP